jgi:hypothetical protein
MKRILAALALALVASVAAAEGTHTIAGIEWRKTTPAEAHAVSAIGLPPARYDHFNPDVEIVRVPASAMGITCRGLFGGSGRKPPSACTFLGPPRCQIILPTESPMLAVLLRHEMGHCNGWTGDHPN